MRPGAAAGTRRAGTEAARTRDTKRARRVAEPCRCSPTNGRGAEAAGEGGTEAAELVAFAAVDLPPGTEFCGRTSAAGGPRRWPAAPTRSGARPPVRQDHQGRRTRRLRPPPSSLRLGQRATDGHRHRHPDAVGPTSAELALGLRRSWSPTPTGHATSPPSAAITAANRRGPRA